MVTGPGEQPCADTGSSIALPPPMWPIDSHPLTTSKTVAIKMAILFITEKAKRVAFAAKFGMLRAESLDRHRLQRDSVQCSKSSP